MKGFHVNDFLLKDSPFLEEFMATRDSILSSDHTKKSLSGRDRTFEEQNSDILRGLKVEYYLRSKYPEQFVGINRDTCNEYLTNHPHYKELFIRTSSGSKINFEYHDLIDIQRGEIVEVKAWVSAKSRHPNEVGKLVGRMRQTENRAFFADRLLIYDYLAEEMRYVLAYKLKWNEGTRLYEYTFREKRY